MDLKPESQGQLPEADPPPPYTPQPCSANSIPNGDHLIIQVKYRCPRDLINNHGGQITREGKSPITFPINIPLCQTTTYACLVSAIESLALTRLRSCSERRVKKGTLTYQPRKPDSGRAKQIDGRNWCCIREAVGWRRGDLVFEIVDLPEGWVEDVKFLRRTRAKEGKGKGKAENWCTCGKGEKKVEGRGGGCAVM